MDIPIQKDIGLPTTEPMALVSEENVDHTIEESLLQESMAPEVEGVVRTVSSKVTTPIAVTVEPEVPTTEQPTESIQPSSSPIVIGSNS